MNTTFKLSSDNEMQRAILQNWDCTPHIKTTRSGFFKWLSPDEDWLKLNSDSFLSSSSAGYAAILRDYKAEVIGMAHSFCSSQPIHLIELRGALLGLQLATNFRSSKSKIWVEMDSALSVQWIKKKVHPL